MPKSTCLRLSVVASVLLMASTALCEAYVPYRTQLTADSSHLKALFGKYASLSAASSGRKTRSVPALRISGRIPGLGYVKASLNRIRIKDWPSYFSGTNGRIADPKQVLLLRGSFLQRSSSRGAPELLTAVAYPSARSLRVKVLLNAQRPGGFAARKFYSLTFDAPLKTNVHTARVRRAPASILNSHTCMEPLSPAGISNLPPRRQMDTTAGYQTAAAQYLRTQFGLEGDYHFYVNNGAESNVQMSATLNAAEAIYERDLSVTFTILAQNVITSSGSSYTSSDVSTLLNQFTARVNSQHHLGAGDLFHLFTGRDLYDEDPQETGVAGIAWVGVVCHLADYSTGLTENISDSIDYLLFAHEVGHNFGAWHDTSLPRSLMYPMAAADQDYFSNTSKGEINAHLDAYGSQCLDTVAAPSPTPTRSPTPTSTAGHTPTSVPGAPTATPTAGGGGTNPGEDLQLPAVSLSSGLAPRGAISVSMTLGGGLLREACSSHMLVSINSGFGSPTSVYAGEGTQAAITAAFNMPFRLAGSSSSRIYLKAVYSCTDAGASARSAVKVLKPTRVRKGPAITYARWRARFISRLRRALTSN